MPTTTLIFVSEHDASPLIHLRAEADEIVEFIATMRRVYGSRLSPSPSRAAIIFLRALALTKLDEWNPTLESVPIFNREGALADAGARPIVWDTGRWEQANAKPAPDLEPVVEGYRP